jgi:hypothetical protein
VYGMVIRLRRALALLVVGSVLATGQAGSAAPAEARGEKHIDIDEFMTGLACIESSGRFRAVNTRSGAYGKYQIMPRNWPVWASRFLRDRWAEPTPRNQEFVARQRIAQLYRAKGSWRRVAYWWLTGGDSPDERRWSAHGAKYVDRVMAIVKQAASPRRADRVPARCLPVPFKEPKIRTEPRERVRVAGGSVYLRRAPGYENRMLGVVHRDTVLPILDRGRDPRGRRWLKVGLRDGRTGWIASWFTRPSPRSRTIR